MNRHFILRGHEAMPVSASAWSQWFEKAKEERIVAYTEIGTISVSTVFLGLDHNYQPGRPHIFETLVFGGPMDGEMERYSTWEEAEAGHHDMVERVKP